MIDITPPGLFHVSLCPFVVVAKGVGDGYGREDRCGMECLTSATGAERSIAVAAFRACSDDFSVNVLGVVGVDVAGAATAVGYFGSCHCSWDGCRQRSQMWKVEGQL